jgi:apolipoprotein D and lipocalin family protein
MRIGIALILFLFGVGAPAFAAGVAATAASAIAFALAPAAGSPSPSAESRPLEVVPHVDIQRYLGIWYEIATIPQRFQRGCVGVTAEYRLRKDGDIDIVNTCHRGTLDGQVRTAHGKAWVVDKKTNAKLKVRFFWPFTGDYWIIALDADYQWAVVGHPNRKYLWILSRTPQMDPALYDELLKLIEAKGYDLSKLKRTLQPGGN